MITKQMLDESAYEEQYGHLGWKAPYMAAAYDWIGTLNVSVSQAKSAKYGYQFYFELIFYRGNDTGMGFIDSYYQELGISPNTFIQERDDAEDRIRLMVSSRDDIRKFLDSVHPFLVVRYEETEVLLEEVFPLLEEKRHAVSKEGFVEVVEAIDHFREVSSTRRQKSDARDADYFREEFNLNDES